MDTTEVANLEASQQVDDTQSSGTQQTQTTSQPVEQLYEVKVNGQTIKVPLNELTNGYSRQRDYTEKTMRLAQEREQWQNVEKQYQSQLNEVQKFLSDPRVQSALRNLQAGITDPSQPLTPEQVHQLQSQEAARQQAMFDARMNQMSQELEVKALATHYSADINSTLNTLLEKHEVLKDIDGIEDLLRKDVLSREPANLQEAKQFFAEAAQARADRIMSRFQTQQKQEAAQRAKLTQGGIETGGHAPIIASEGKKFKLGTNDLFQAAVSDLMQSAIK